MQYTVMSYNIERMRDLFHGHRIRAQMEARARAIAQTVHKHAPHILGIVEASDKLADHQHFLMHSRLKDLQYQVAKGDCNRGKMDLVCYFREPFEVVSIDQEHSYYDDWVEDIDNDSIDEVMRFERKPLEVSFRIRNTDVELLVILVSLKSKGVFSVADIHRYEYLALANRKKLYGQSRKLRQRMDQLLEQAPHRAVIIMGDLNDEVGMDHFQKIVGASAVETIMGDLHSPARIMHNALWHLRSKMPAKLIWTNEYADPIVANLRKHRALLDHIFVSPGMLLEKAPLRYVAESGAIAEKDDVAAEASDHFPVFCRIED